jgi:hypothetical protein
MQLTYTSHLHTAIQCVLDAGETLGSLEGPAVDYCKTDGDSDVYAAIQEQGLDIIDPLETEVVGPTLEAQRTTQAEKAEAARAEAAGEEGEENEGKSRKSNRKHK